MEESDMKTFIFILALGWMVSFASASEIIISSFDRSEISVTLDGFRINGRSKQLFLGDVAPGNHVMEVFASKRSPRHGMNLVKIFSGSFFINANTRIEMRVNAYNELVVLRNEPLYANNGYNYSCSNNSYNGLYNGNEYYNENAGNYGGNIGNSCSNYYMGLTEFQFNALKSSMRNASFDSNKLNIAKSAISANGIYASDLLELMSLLSFDSNRLELAKYSFPFLVDKGNAFLISNGFTFSSNADEFLEYIHY